MGLSTTYTKTETDFLIQQLEKKTASGYKGDLIKTDAAPTQLGFYMLSETGVYTNLGGIDAQAGKINFASFDGTTWSLIAVDMPKAADSKTIEDWSPKTYVAGSNVFKDGKIWGNTVDALSTDVPGVSTKWVEKIGSVKLDISGGALGFDTFISNRRKISITKDDFVNNGSVFDDGRINTNDTGYWHYTNFIQIKNGDIININISGDSAHRTIVKFDKNQASNNNGLNFTGANDTTSNLTYTADFDGYIKINNKKAYQANPNGYREVNLQEKETVTSSVYNLKNVVKFDVLNPAILDKITSTHSFTKSVDEKGLRITVDVGTKPARWDLNIPELANIYSGRNYAIVTEIQHVINYGASIGLTAGNISNGMSLTAEGNSSEWAKYPILKSVVGKATTNTINNLSLYLYNDGKVVSGTFADFYIKKLIIIDLGSDAEKPPFDAKFYETLVKANKYFTNIAVPKFVSSTPMQSLYNVLKLKSLGDSLPETRTFQPYIASIYGMNYNLEEEITTVTDGSNTYYRSTWGGSRVAPTIVGSGSTGANGSIYIRAMSLKYWKPDVLLILAGANDVRAGSAHITGGTATQPADYGLNDAAYTGGEIDLVADKTQSVPSFGAAYRGMLHQIFTDMPNCRVILISPPRPSGGTVPNSADYLMAQGKDAVIRQIAKEFGCPFVSLFETYGPNQFTRDYLTKDGLHFGTNGGKRVAMEILKVF